jgi:hypothetical protein
MTSLVRGYFRSGKEVVRLREDAIRRAMDDPRALGFGIAFFLASMLLFVLTYLVLFEVVPNPTPLKPGEPSLGVQMWLGVGVYTLIGYTALIIGHFVIRMMARSGESLSRLMRPVMLGSVVLLLNVIPGIGPIVGEFWWAFRVVPGVTRVVHGVSFGKALGLYLLSAIPSAVIWILIVVGLVKAVRGTPG